MKKLLIIIFIFIFLAGQAAMAGDTTYSLEQCLEMARTRNPAILASIEKKVEAEWQKQSAHDDFLPKLNMDYSYTYLDEVHNINANFIGIGEVSITEHDNFKMGVYIDQPLFTGFVLTTRYNLAELGLQEAVAGEELANLEITFQTVRAYYYLLLSMKFEEVMEASVAQLTSHYKDSQQFYKNEIIPLNDLLQSEVHLANARQDAEIAANRTTIARRSLATIIKEPIMLNFTVIDSYNEDPLTSEVDKLALMAMDKRPELKRANYNVQASREEITLAKSSYYPTVVLRAAHNRYGGDPLVDGHGLSDLQVDDESTIGIYAKWQLFAWGQTKHNINAASAASRAAGQRLIKVMDEIQKEVHDSFSNAITVYTNIATSKKAVKQAKENLRMNTVRYKNQISTTTDVLDAQTLLTETQTKYYWAVYQYNIWLAGLARSVGVQSWKDLQVN